MLRMNLTGLVLGAATALLLFAAGAAAEEKADNWGAGALCPACAGKVFTTDIGTCKSCGRGTSSGAFKLCQACGRKLGKCQACGAELKGEKSLISLALASQKEKCASIEEIKLTIVLKNESQKDILVNSRMMCHAELSLEVKSPDGKALSYTPHEPPTAPDPKKDFTILKPGESVTKELGSGYLHLSALQWRAGGAMPMARGKYEIKAVYQHPAAGFEMEERKANAAWTGRLESNVVTVELVEAKAATAGKK